MNDTADVRVLVTHPLHASAGILMLVAGLLHPHPGWSAESGASEPKPALGRSEQTATNGTIRQVAPGRFEIGKVHIDQVKRTVSFPAFVNLRKGPIEYLLVADFGKIHDSLLRTEVDPSSIQLALLLLGATPAETTTNTPAPPSTRKSQGRMEIEITWRVKNRVRRQRAESFVWDRQARGKLAKGNWFFGGSRFRPDGFAAQMDGSIVTVIDDEDAIIGSRARNREDDDNWLAYGDALPESDESVEVVLTLPR